MRGRGLLCREAPSLALPPEETVWIGRFWGRDASLREASLPQTPSPEERLAIELEASSELVPPVRWSAVFDKLGCGHGG